MIPPNAVVRIWVAFSLRPGVSDRTASYITASVIALTAVARPIASVPATRSRPGPRNLVIGPGPAASAWVAGGLVIRLGRCRILVRLGRVARGLRLVRRGAVLLGRGLVGLHLSRVAQVLGRVAAERGIVRPLGLGRGLVGHVDLLGHG